MPKAFVLLNTEIGSEEEVLKSLKTIQGVQEAHLVYGVYDLIAQVHSDDMDTLKNAIMSKIRQLDKVRSTLTMISLDKD